MSQCAFYHFTLYTRHLCFPSGRKHLNRKRTLFSTKNIRTTATSFPCFTSYTVVSLQLNKKLKSLTSRSSSCSFLICSKRNCSAISLSCASRCRTSDKLISLFKQNLSFAWLSIFEWFAFLQTQY